MNKRHDDELFIRHIEDALELIESYLKGITQADFRESPLVQDGVLHQIQIVGEATKRLSSEFRSRMPGIRWADIAGMRDKIVHDYMHVDVDLVWETATRDIPVLKAALKGLDQLS